jgi:hypothetical protein
MSRRASVALIHQAEFRARRAETDIRAAVERLRPVAQIPGYHGLDIAYIEQVAELVGQARQAIDEWGREVARHRPRSVLHCRLTNVDRPRT